MGYFHEGHLELMKSARQSADTVVVSLFVNPLQFNDPSDLERYPRDLERDLSLAAGAGVDLVFAPPRSEMLPEPPLTAVTVAALTERMEGSGRPGHFSGVATVVAKLFAGLQPHLAYFGRKDAQQLAVVRRMASDLSFPVRVLGHPTIRESDGLALSSRNVLLSEKDRVSARELSAGLMAAAAAAEAGERSGPALEGIAKAAVASAHLEYIELASQETVERLPTLDRPAFLALAARVGEVRLIDNVGLEVVAGELVADRGVRLEGPSLLYR
jgi:pantoate--beta-alanine ligase